MTDAAEIQGIDDVLFAIQSDPPKILKSKKGQVGSQITRYADLGIAYDEVMPLLTRMGALWKTKATRLFDQEGAPFVLHYELKHMKSGEKHEGDYPLKLAENSQQMGSAITYARRYALFTALNLIAEDEDDDGRATAGERKQREPRPPREAAPTVRRDPPPARQRAVQERPPARQDATAEAEKVGPPRNPDAPVSREQQNHMFALFGDLGYGGDVNRAGRLAVCEKLTGRKVGSTNELTMGEAHTVIEGLIRKQEYEARKAAEKPAARKPAANTGAQRPRREQITGTPDDSAGPAPWEPGDGELATETGGKL